MKENKFVYEDKNGVNYNKFKNINQPSEWKSFGLPLSTSSQKEKTERGSCAWKQKKGVAGGSETTKQKGEVKEEVQGGSGKGFL